MPCSASHQGLCPYRRWPSQAIVAMCRGRSGAHGQRTHCLQVAENLHGGTFGRENDLATQSLPMRPSSAR